MSLAALERDLKERLHGHHRRLHHVYGVRDTALKLGKIQGADLDALRWAALLHDLTKYDPPTVQKQRILRHYDPDILSEYPEPLHHAFDAVVVARETYGIDDERILKAIESHTLGRPGMELTEKILFVSDYVEPTRQYPSCVKAREQAFINLDNAVMLIIHDTIRYLEREGKRIPATAYETLNYYQKAGD
ncbi:MAG: HD domain-containing protein [Acholeplasmatales bacterium]|nr:MAG: HD domain-containing protein [Acholeplasmatales bacterium]